MLHTSFPRVFDVKVQLKHYVALQTSKLKLMLNDVKDRKAQNDRGMLQSICDKKQYRSKTCSKTAVHNYFAGPLTASVLNLHLLLHTHCCVKWLPTCGQSYHAIAFSYLSIWILKNVNTKALSHNYYPYFYCIPSSACCNHSLHIQIYTTHYYILRTFMVDRLAGQNMDGWMDGWM